MTRFAFGPPDSRGLPLLYRPVPYGCSTVFVFTVLGVFLGPLLFPGPPEMECDNWFIAALGMGGILGFVVGLVASPLVGAYYSRQPGPPPAPRE
jgi:hypothetical protein